MARFGRSFPIRPWIRKTLASVFTTILPAAAAIALSGSAPSVSQNFQFTPSAGNLAVSGAAPTAQQNAQFAPGAASLALSGVAPTAQQNAKPLPNAGSLGLTGVAPGETLTSNFSPAAGSLVSTGATPTAQQTTQAAPAAAALTLAGVAPTAQQNAQPSPGAATLTLSGAAPTAQQNAQSLPGAASLALSGIAPTAQQNAKPLPSAGSLSLAGVAPAETLTSNFSPVAASLALSGVAPTVQQTSQAAPASASLAATGATPALTLTLRFSPTAGALALSGVAPTVLSAGTFSPAAASLALAGLAPTLTLSQSASPGSAALAIIGVAPTVQQQSSGPTPSAASLTLTGATPSVTLPLRTDWPAAILGSVILVDGYSHTRKAGLQRQEMESGFDRIRITDLNPQRNVSATFLFSEDQLQYFSSWLEYRARTGETWFFIDLPIEGTARNVQVRILGEPSQQPLSEPATDWLVRITLDVVDPNTVSRTVFDIAHVDDGAFPVSVLGDTVLFENYGSQRKPGGVGSDQNTEGVPQFRLQTLTPFRSVKLTWNFDDTQLAYFNAWLEYRARYGGAFFTIDLPIDSGTYRNVKARFAAMPVVTNLAKDIWRCSAELEVRDLNQWSRGLFTLYETYGNDVIGLAEAVEDLTLDPFFDAWDVL